MADKTGEAVTANCYPVLAPGASDAAEGTVLVAAEVAGDATATPARIAVAPAEGCRYYPEQQPGEGYWAVAPGCADISEGMVWVKITAHATPQ